MKLSFYARGDILVPVPGQTRPVGQTMEMVSGPPVRYIAREFVAPVGLRKRQGKLTCDEPAKYICSEQPYTCDSDTDVGRRLVRHMTRKNCRRNGSYPLWPADKATADFLGIPFTAIKITNGEAVPTAAKVAEKKAD